MAKLREAVDEGYSHNWYVYTYIILNHPRSLFPVMHHHDMLTHRYISASTSLTRPNNRIIDNLPAASITVDDVYQTTYYSRGFLVGGKDEKDQYVLNNHVRIFLDFHRLDNSKDQYRVVGFRVRPFSVAHKFEGR